MIDTLNVFLWGRKVGTLISAKGAKSYQNTILFYFDSSYTQDGYDIAPLTAPIKGLVAQKGLPFFPEKNKVFNDLPSFISDSLPDHWGNKVFNEWAQRHHIPVRKLSSLDRLSYIGRRGMGALEFQPTTSKDMETAVKLDFASLNDMAEKSFEAAKDFKTELDADLLIDSLFRVGTSAGGKRPKAILNINFERGLCYSGQVPSPEPGYVPMIVKFDENGQVPTTRIEYSYYLLAKEVGLRMMESRLLSGDRLCHFATERFDRNSGEKIHIQTLAAMDPNSNSYESLFDVANKLGVTQKEINQLFLQMVMNVLCGNVDDHNKNFSFLMNRDGKWHIAPTYDFTFSIDTQAPRYVNRHSMSICNKADEISGADLLEIARRYNVKSASSTINKAKDIVGHFAEFGREAGLEEKWINIILQELEKITANL
jgi:serine/threonine-protein kinase HipA